MAKNQTPAASTTKFKRGNVTLDGVNFDDAHARKLKPGKYAPDGPDSPELSAEERFIKEHSHHYTDLSDTERIELLKKAFVACLEAE